MTSGSPNETSNHSHISDEGGEAQCSIALILRKISAATGGVWAVIRSEIHRFLVTLQSEYQLIQRIMTKAEIASEIAKTTGIDKATVVTVIEQFMTVVKDSLAHGENVYLRGFGSFIVKTRAEKTARNISKNTTIIIPAHNIPAFKPANTFKEEVAKV